jgi:hypothetical protein
MPTYNIDLKVPVNLDTIEALIESLRTVGAVDSLQFTIEAPTRAKAVRETEEVLEEFSATYRGTYLAPATKELIEKKLRLVPTRAAKDLIEEKLRPVPTGPAVSV